MLGEETIDFQKDDMIHLAPKKLGSSSESETEEHVKSTAVVKFAAVDTPAKFAELHSNTNLNLPPSNWLRQTQGCEALVNNPKSSPGMTEPKIFSSFQMAYNFPDYIGEVDVVSDSENIKKMLKIPFSKSQISMLVHRIGKTILIDEFDIHRYLIRTAEKEWDWLRKFYIEHVLQSLHLKEKSFARKNKSRYCLQNKSMFSKFLYYSVADSTETSDGQRTCETGDGQRSTLEEKKFSCDIQIPVSSASTQYSDAVPEENEFQEEYSGDHKFLRDVLWTFEDITMLIGSNMPIFGGGTHPCVSLRLRDKNNPINVLTGLDYWLDNLMCNVPEVVMCYHLNGIVQKYEILKTEDIPLLDNSKFSAKLIKDIAQNILSFLKTNATKAGHTYWLFKGKDDDVVKLYDLSSLCESYVVNDKEQNPFAMHVALLLHTVARNMYSQQCTKKQRETLLFLLKNCVALLDGLKHPQVVISSHFLLADLYLPSDESCDESEANTEEEEIPSEDEYFPNESSTETNHSKPFSLAPSSSVEVEALCLSHKPLPMNDENCWLEEKIKRNIMERCHLALEHVAKGLEYIDKNYEDTMSNKMTKNETVEEVQKMAKPFQPIPLKYSPLKSSQTVVSCSTDDDNYTEIQKPHKCPKWQSKDECEKKSRTCWMSTMHKPSCPLSQVPWQVTHKINLLKKGASALYLISENLWSDNRIGMTLRCLQVAVLCLEGAQSLLYTYELSTEGMSDCLQKCIYLAGDLHHKLGLLNTISEVYKEEFQVIPPIWESLTKSIQQIQDFSGFDFMWKMGVSSKEHLMTSISCYNEILLMQENDNESSWKCQQRIGSTYNELAVKQMLAAESEFLDSQTLSEKVQTLWNESNSYFVKGLETLKKIKDIPNLALVTSNLGRLMRLQAHFIREKKQKEFSLMERRYYQKAIKYYKEAFAILKIRNEHPPVWETIMWEYCTTLFCMANLLQDYAPLSSRAQEDIEQEIICLYTEALQYCDVDSNGPRQPLCQYRAATIHQRIASLYHNAIRNEIMENSHKHKNLRSEAEKHYEAAANLFQTMERIPEYLRVKLEFFGMQEFIFQKKSGFSSRVRALHQMMMFLLSMKPSIAMLLPNVSSKVLDGSSSTDVNSIDDDKTPPDDECKDVHRLLVIVWQQLQTVLSKLVKLHSGKKSNHQAKELYKKLYDISTSLSSEELTDPVQTPAHLYHLLELMENYAGNLRLFEK